MIGKEESIETAGKRGSLDMLRCVFNIILHEDLSVFGPRVDMQAHGTDVEPALRRPRVVAGQIGVFGEREWTVAYPSGFLPRSFSGDFWAWTDCGPSARRHPPLHREGLRCYLTMESSREAGATQIMERGAGSVGEAERAKGEFSSKSPVLRPFRRLPNETGDSRVTRRVVWPHGRLMCFDRDGPPFQCWNQSLPDANVMDRAVTLNVAEKQLAADVFEGAVS